MRQVLISVLLLAIHSKHPSSRCLMLVPQRLHVTRRSLTGLLSGCCSFKHIAYSQESGERSKEAARFNRFDEVSPFTCQELDSLEAVPFSRS